MSPTLPRCHGETLHVEDPVERFRTGSVDRRLPNASRMLGEPSIPSWKPWKATSLHWGHAIHFHSWSECMCGSSRLMQIRVPTPRPFQVDLQRPSLLCRAAKGAFVPLRPPWRAVRNWHSPWGISIHRSPSVLLGTSSRFARAFGLAHGDGVTALYTIRPIRSAWGRCCTISPRRHMQPGARHIERGFGDVGKELALQRLTAAEDRRFKSV